MILPSSADLMQNWYQASQQKINTTERIKLYERTQITIAHLNHASDEDKKSFCQAVQQFSDTKTEADLIKLSKWIAKNTGVDENGYNGAYGIFHELFNAATHLKDETTIKKFALENIDSKALETIRMTSEKKTASLQSLVKDAELYALSKFSLKDLISMSVSSSQNREKAKSVLIHQLNTGKITLDEMGFKTMTEIINFFGERCSEITQINLHFSIDDINFKNLSKKFPKIQYLCLKNPTISDDSVSFLRKMNHLKELDLSGCESISDISFLEDCKKLTSLNLSGCSQIDDFSFLEDCQGLTSLDLSDCSHIDDFSFLQHCKNLTHLNLSGCECMDDISFLQHCKKLTHLELSGCTEVRDFSYLQHCKELTCLKLSECTQITDISILHSIKSLKSLDLSKCIQIRDFSSILHCKELVSLNIMDCKKIGDLNFLDDCKKLAALYL